MRRLALIAIFTLVACNGIGQSPECAQYLKCTEAAIPGSSINYDSSYGEHGTCWSTDGNAARNCTAACVQARSLLAAGAGQGKVDCQ